MKPETLIAQATHLPALSPSVLRVLELLARPEASNDDMTKVVQQDAVMSAKLLGMCNSALYGLSTPVASIAQAVLMLGQSEIQRLVLSVGFGGALSPALAGYGISDKELWRHSLLTANIAAAVIPLVHRPPAEESVAYTAGLLHDIGKVVIACALDPIHQKAIRELLARPGCSMMEAERQLLGTDHAEVGACLLEQWGLPAILVEAVSHHHQPVFQPELKLSAIAHVADVVALASGSAPGWGGLAVRPDEDAVAALGLARDDIDNLLITACDALPRVVEMVSAT